MSMPNDGLHSVQVFGNDSLGTIYESEVRYFTIGSTSSASPFNLTIIIVFVFSNLGLAGAVSTFYILYTKRKGRVLLSFCPFCGVKLPVVIKYCTNCGERIKSRKI